MCVRSPSVLFIRMRRSGRQTVRYPKILLLAASLLIRDCGSSAVEPVRRAESSEAQRCRDRESRTDCRGNKHPIALSGRSLCGPASVHCRVDGIINQRKGVDGEEFGIGFAIALPEEAREVRLNASSTHPPRSGSRSADHCETRRIRAGHARVYKRQARSPLMGRTGLSYANRKLSPRRPFPVPACT